MSEQTAEQLLSEASEHFNTGNYGEAWSRLNLLVRFPSSEQRLTEDNWTSVFLLFNQLVGVQPGFEKLQSAASSAAQEMNDINVLYSFGYELIEVQMNQVAATVLSRANQLAPNTPGIVAEFATALESSGMCAQAAELLEQARPHGVNDFFFTYLLGFTSFMSGNVERTRELSNELGEPSDENSLVMSSRIKGLLERHDAVAGVSPLDSEDLRGWHYATCGSLLTHYSPHGPEVMRGRYAMVQDNESLLHEGVMRLQAVLDAWQYQATEVRFLPDRSSEILATTVGVRLGLPFGPFDPNTSGLGTIIVAYDFFEADPQIMPALQVRNGEVLFAHAMCWTEDYPLVADVSTFQYQSNVAPWAAGRMKIDPDTQEMTRSEPDTSSPYEFATRILMSEVRTEDLADIETLTNLARQVGPPAPGQRQRYFQSSPVASNRFI